MPIDRAVLFRLATSRRLEAAFRATAMTERLAWRAASRYVAGSQTVEALTLARRLCDRGIGSSIDQFGEHVTDASVAGRIGDDYVRLATELQTAPEDVWLSVDLTHLGLDIDPAACADRLANVASHLGPGRRIQVGAEDHRRSEAVLRCVVAVADRGLSDRIGATVQANLRRAPDDLAALVDAGVYLRLVKGAYVEEPRNALPYGESTDVAYVRLAHRLAEAGAQFALATHDGVLREALLAALGPRPVEQLLGVREEVLEDLLARSIPVRVYVPFGVNWFRYWMRRVAESRGA